MNADKHRFYIRKRLKDKRRNGTRINTDKDSCEKPMEIFIISFRDACVVARGQRPFGEKASAGLALFLEALIDFRKVRRADPGTGSQSSLIDRLPYPRREALHRRFKRLARLVHEMEAPSRGRVSSTWFLPKRSLPPSLASDRH